MEVASLLQLDQELGILGQISRIRELLDSIGVQAIPGLDKGEMDSIRLFRFRPTEVGDEVRAVEDLLANYESHDVEFKSTLRVDLKRLQQTGQPAEQCKSDDVLHATLKTIAAFLNTEGGRLLIGVDDDRNILGLSYDLQLADTPNEDKLELYLRNCLTGKFKNGGMVNDFVFIKFVPMSDKIVALVEVLPRRLLSFVKKDNQYCLCRRQGNRTTQVDISEIEEFLGNRWGK